MKPDPSNPAPSKSRRVRRSRGWMLAFVLTALALVGIVGWQHWGPNAFRPQDIHTPDGTPLTLVSVQSGKFHHNPLDPMSARIAGTLPEKWTKRWKLRRPTPFRPVFDLLKEPPTAKDSVSLWFVSRHPQSPGQILLDGVSIVDTNGRVLAVASHLHLDLLRDGRDLVAYRFETLPTRLETLRIVLTKGTPGGKTATSEFTIRNPTFNPQAPAFLSAPLPMTARDGPIDITLHTLRVHWKTEVWHVSGPIAHAEFSTTQHGIPTTEWRPIRVGPVIDATGNQNDGLLYSAQINQAFFLQPSGDFAALPTDEPWRFRVWFLHETGIAADEFATNEVWRLRALPIAPNELDYPTTVTRLRGKELRVEFLALNRRYVPPDGKPISNDVHAIFRVFSKPDNKPENSRVVVLRAVDDHGRDVTPVKRFGSYADIHLDLSPGAKTMDIDLAFAPVRSVWFTARPDFPR